MHTIMAPKHIAIISKSEQISIVFIRIRSLYPKSVENCTANVWQYPNKKYKIPTLGCTIKGFLVCNLYRNRTPKHLFHSEIAKNATIRRKIAKMYWLFLVFSRNGILLLSFFLIFLPFAGRETSDGLEAVLQIIAMAETAGIGYGLKFVVFVFNQHTLGLLDAEL